MSNNLKTALGNINFGLNKTYNTVVSTTTTTTATYTNSNHQTHKVDTPVDASTKFKDLNTTGTADNSCTITVYNGTTTETISLNKESTVGDLINALNTKGFSADINNGVVTISSLGDAYIKGVNGNYMTCLKITGDYYTVGEETFVPGHITVSDTQDRIITVTMSQSSTFAELFAASGQPTNGSGEIHLNYEGVDYTVTITSDKTVDDMISTLGGFGISGSVTNGTLTLVGTSDGYITSMDNNIRNALKLNVGDGYTHTSFSTTTISGYTDGSDIKTRTVIRAATSDMQLTQLISSTGASLGITSGQIYAYRDGTRSVVNINNNDTIDTLSAKLAQYGITINMSSDGRLYFDGNNNSYLTTDGIASGSRSNILEKINVSNEWSTRYDSTSQNLQYNTTSNVAAKGNTRVMSLQNESGDSLGITGGTYDVVENGVVRTETITEDTTVDDLIATLGTYGMIANLDDDGSMAVGAYNNTFMKTAGAPTRSNLVDVLFDQWDFTNIYTSNHLEVQENVTAAITRTTKLADINEGVEYQAGNLTVVHDGIQTNISIGADATVGSFLDELALYGFDATINTNGQVILRNTGDSRLQAYTGAGQATNALDILGIGALDWISTNAYESDLVEVVTITNSDVAIDRNTGLSELGVTTGEYCIYSNGVRYTALVSSDETIGSLIDTLSTFGIQSSIVNTGDSSVLKLVGAGESYVTASASTTNASNIASVLFPNANSSTSYNYEAGLQTSTLVTTHTDVTEDTLLSDVNRVLAGAPSLTQGNISVTVDDETSLMQIAADETFGSLMDKFRRLGLEATLTDGVLTVQSGYKEMVINTSDPQQTSNLMSNLGLEFKEDLGGYTASSIQCDQTTTTIEDRTLSVANYADFATKMSLLNISSGSMAIYRNGQKATIQVNSDQTFGDLRSSIQSAFGDVDIKFENGYLSFYSTTEGVQVDVGSTTDTSNFISICGISNNGTGTVTSSRELYRVNGSSTLVNTGLFRRGDVTEGTFVVGNATFTVTATTTLNNIITQINASDEANATAYWDSVDGHLVIKSRTSGSSYINIEAGTSNFTDIMGYTESEWNLGTGEVTLTKMKTDSQDVGTNAKFTINGTEYSSSSNTITSDVSRIHGVTFNLKNVSDGESVTLTIEKDAETAANAVAEVVDAYNELMENVEAEIARGANLSDQITLKSIRNQLKSLMTSSIVGIEGGEYRNINAVGITLPKASASNLSTSNISHLTFDKDEFEKAFRNDSRSIEYLLVGNDSIQGVFSRIEDVLETSAEKYFTSADKSYSQKISRLDEKIKKTNKAVERYRARLEAKFSTMDMLISQMQNQYASFLRS